MTYNERKQLAKNNVTLDGETATISGLKNDFATVWSLESGKRFEWSWDAVKRIVENKQGDFKS